MEAATLRVLLVEGAEADYLALRESLAKGADTAAHLDWAAAYDEALQVMRTKPYDVYLLDERLARREGVELLQQARAQGCRGPFVLLTTDADLAVDEAALKAGWADCVVKEELSARYLRRVVRHAVERELTLQAMQRMAETERRRAAETQSRLGAAVDQLSEAVLITSGEGTVVYVNPAFEKITGHAGSEVIGRNFRAFQNGKHEASFYQQVWDTLKRGGVWAGQWTSRRKDGTSFIAKVSLSAVRDSSGTVLNHVAVVRDVTYELQMEEQLRQAEKMKAIGLLAGGVAHDFNNILTVITGYSYLLFSKLPPADPMRTQVEEIQKSAERASTLTQQLLAFSRKQILQPKVFDLTAVLSGMEAMLHSLLGEQVALDIVCGAAVAPVRMDQGQMEQVIINLAMNARDAMPEGGRFTITIASVELTEPRHSGHGEIGPGRYVTLTLSDTGAGMTDEVKQHLFEPFFTTKGHGMGAGLGLAMCDGVIEQSQGYIHVSSEVGHGTTFRIYLPAVAAEAALRPHEAASGESASSHETVLVVEDELPLRHLAAGVLRDAGYTVLEASNGREGLHIIENDVARKIDLVVTDIIMPEMNGAEMTTRLKAARPGTKVLFMSGYTDDALALHGVLKSGVAFLGKPFSPEQLAHKVREVLNHRGNGS